MSWRGRGIGWGGGIGSVRHPGPIRDWPTRSPVTCSSRSPTALTSAPSGARHLATVATRHVTIDKLNAAISDVINAHLRGWGDARTVAGDGTQIDAWIHKGHCCIGAAHMELWGELALSSRVTCQFAAEVG